MLPEEFSQKEKLLLIELEVPEELKSIVSWIAYEDAHSSSYEDVLSRIRDLWSNLKEPIEEYAQRVYENGMEDFMSQER